ncbi:MAG: hydrogenase formation protein HypD [Phycisphaerales bacterium]|nr:hydrogenase formation protein HypD [Phycisphaerales bacterium]
MTNTAQSTRSSELRDSLAALRQELHVLANAIGRTIRIMEVCGTHTVSIFRSGLRAHLPTTVRMISGPGCPVCVTAQSHIDAVIRLAARPEVIIATYGDMLRVPGRTGSLEIQRARGADVRIVQSARTALRLARDHPSSEVVFLGVGFETTAPATAATIHEAAAAGITNFSVLMSHKRVVPAMRALLENGEVRIDGFLCPGHVSVIIGARAYQSIVDEFRRPCVIAGFEPEAMLRGITRIVRQIAAQDARLENMYAAVVSEIGNTAAQRALDEVFEACATPWRELGVIESSGYALREKYRQFDATERFRIAFGPELPRAGCICGRVITGAAEPSECKLFARGCTPLTPIGPCMVSGEGTCAAWYRFGR